MHTRIVLGRSGFQMNTEVFASHLWVEEMVMQKDCTLI